VVTLGSQVEAWSSYRVNDVKVCSLVLEQHVHNPWVAIPTRYFKRYPLLPSKHIGIDMLFRNQIIDNTLISYGACDMKWWEFIAAELIQVNDDVGRHGHGLLPFILVQLTFLGVDDLGLFHLVLLDEADEFLLLAVYTNHVVDFINQHRVTELSGLNHLFFRLLRLLLNASAKGWQRLVVWVAGHLGPILDHGVRAIVHWDAASVKFL
jgi:hypothetical protein